VGIASFEGGFSSRLDQVVVEAPLELRLAFGPADARLSTSLTVTMRSPEESSSSQDEGKQGLVDSQDGELAMGLLVAEGIVHSFDEIQNIERCGSEGSEGEPRRLLRIELSPSCEVELDRLKRSFVSSASCGLCGKAGLEALSTTGLARLEAPAQEASLVSQEILRALPAALRSAQQCFGHTGGLHAAASFDPRGRLLFCREDVGRHNAVDKVVGAHLRSGLFPARENILMLSGRVSFELVQKAVAAGFSILAAIGAPTSLAIELAEEFNLSLVGFLSERRFNLYSHPSRVSDRAEPARSSAPAPSNLGSV